MAHLFIALFFISTIPLAGANIEQRSFTIKDTLNLDLENKLGKVTIVGEDSKEVKIVARKLDFSESCQLEMGQSKKGIKIRVDDSSFTGLARCAVDFIITVPKKLALIIKNGNGDIRIKNTLGQINYMLGKGNVKIDSSVTKLVGKSGLGNINLTGTAIVSDIKAGSGDVTIKYLSVPSKGNLNIDIGKGNSTITMPKSTRIKTSLKSALGEKSNELGDDPSALFNISMKAGMGGLSVKSSD
ncbi:MAG: hypothetical protein HOE90_09070 [Bacteriovoracaceae bacterium]|nr:hypothetical protein [Bacteriovoracaceae bacterium]